MSDNNKIKPFIKWAGGKEKEWKYIKDCLPDKINRYIEPFVGGGAVYFDMNISNSYINDKSTELMNLYGCIKNNNTEFLNDLSNINQSWKKIEKFLEKNSNELLGLRKEYSNIMKENMNNSKRIKDSIEGFIKNYTYELIEIVPKTIDIAKENFIKEISRNLYSKITRMYKIELKKGELSKKDEIDNLECALKSAFYMHLRYIYNNAEKLKVEMPLYTAIFYFIREYCYASMFRYNSNGKFNVPYGGISYNRKYQRNTIKNRKEDMICQLYI